MKKKILMLAAVFSAVLSVSPLVAQDNAGAATKGIEVKTNVVTTVTKTDASSQGGAVANTSVTSPSARQPRRGARPTIAVLPFIVDETIRVTIGNQTLIPRRVETEFTSMLMNFLVKSRKFDVLERDYLRKILNENNITESEYAKPGEAERIGKLLVADYLVIGHIDRLTFSRRVKNIALTGETAVNLTGNLKVSFRIVQVKSGKIVFADSVSRKIRSEDIKKEVPYSERKDWTPADYKERLFTDVAKTSGSLILEGIYPVKVASVQPDGMVILNRGGGAGIKVGKKYEVFNAGEAVVDPDTGEMLGAQEIKCGEIIITDVHPKFSKGRIVSSMRPVTQGSICRSVKKSAPAEKAPAYPRATPGW